MTEIYGHCDPAFTQLSEQFSQNLDSGADIGASLCVMRGDDVVVDIWGGVANLRTGKAWERDSILSVFSTTKTMTYLVMLILRDRGLLDFDAPVANYWPEFAAQGKSNVLVRHVMSHTAGLPGWGEILDPRDLNDWEKCTSLLAQQPTWWTPGEMSGYHPITQGFLLGEICRRITGVTLGTFLRSEISQPLGADFHIGLPESEDHRLAEVIPFVDQVVHPEGSTAQRAWGSAQLGADIFRRWFRAAEIPSVNGIGNARSVALIQSIVTGRGSTQGINFLSEETVDLVFQTQHFGFDVVTNFEFHYGMGYGLNCPGIPMGPRGCGWGGHGGSAIMMDQDSGITFAYAMNRLVHFTNDTRADDYYATINRIIGA
jgi:CubicO group peptidase (beta-lactamase class C family)